MKSSTDRPIRSRLKLVLLLGAALVPVVAARPSAAAESPAAPSPAASATDQLAVTAGEPDLAVHLDATEPKDEKWIHQWALHESSTEQGIGVLEAWDRSTGSAATVVAVIDSGIIPHPDLRNVLLGWDFVDGDPRPLDDMKCVDQPPTLHGTHVAGLIVAARDNRIGVVGVAPDALVLAIRAVDACGAGTMSTTVRAIRWAAGLDVAGAPLNPTPARIINLSLGSASATCPTAYQDAIDEVTALGVIVVTSAGDGSTDVAGWTPANCAGTITVTATDQLGERAATANTGDEVDIAAPGVDVYSTDRDPLSTKGKNGSWPAGVARRSGTSSAAPLVSGALALLAAVEADLDSTSAAAALAATARPFPSSCLGCGAGLLDAGSLLATSTPAFGLVSPAAGARWQRGEQVRVTWEDAGTGTVKVELVTAGRVDKITSRPASQSYGLGVVPNAAALGPATLRITAVSSSRPITTRVIERPIVVVAPELRIVAPEVVAVGRPIKIAWTSKGFTRDRVTLAVIDSAGVRRVLRDKVASASGALTYQWPVTQLGPVTFELTPPPDSPLATETFTVEAVVPSLTFEWPTTVAANEFASISWEITPVASTRLSFSTVIDGRTVTIGAIRVEAASGTGVIKIPAKLRGKTFTLTASAPNTTFASATSATYTVG